MTIEFDHNKGSYNFELWNCMEGAVDSYIQDRQAYWENMGGFSVTDYDRAERFAEAVFKSSERLMPTGEIGGDLSKLKLEINKLNKLSDLDKRMMKILDLDLSWDKKHELICDLAKECPPDPDSDDSPLKLVWERLSIKLAW
jgi:hypothetical protein